MKVNWTVRFKNKVWLASFFAAILTFVYTMLGMFDVYPEVTKNDVGEIINSLLMFLSLVGVIQDPTTDGIGDSLRALAYDKPWVDVHDDGTEEHAVDALLDNTPGDGTVELEPEYDETAEEADATDE